MGFREEQIINMFPKGVETVLDIGSLGDMFKLDFDTTSIDILPEADIKQNLNINQRLSLEDDSFDVVVMNQILEHLPDVEELISEAKRISKKYILIGLPNEVTYDNRLRILFGNPQWKGYRPYFHKHYFTINEIDKFIEKFFDGEVISKKYYFACAGGRFIPRGLRMALANIRPQLFAKEVYYLIDLNLQKTSETKR